MNETDISHLFLALVSLLIAALGMGFAFERMRMPRVIGEIVGGLLLGPSVMGILQPNVFTWLFASTLGQARALEALYWIGLVLLMFTSGFHIQRDLSRDDRRMIWIVLIAATVPPFLLGYYAPTFFDLARHVGPAANDPAFRLVMGIATAVTSIPVISRIFLDLKIMETQFARIVLGCATLHDLILWIALAMATGMVANGATGSADPWLLARTIVVSLLFLGLALWLGPKVLAVISRHRLNVISRSSPTGYTLAICLVFAALASGLGVNIIFGALIAGIAVGAIKDSGFDDVKARISDVALGFFVPIYFALLGLKIDLPSFFDPTLTIGFIVLTTTAQMGSVFIALRIAGKDSLVSFNLGIAMNTRGGPGIVLASVAYGWGIIGGAMFVTLVLAAILTSLASGAWFRFLLGRGLPLYR